MIGRAVLFDLDDTLLDYSGSVADCWDAACTGAAETGIDPAALARTVHEVRAWFWADRDRHARERVDMLRAWTTIVSLALERLGRPSELVARAVADDFASRRMLSATLFDDAVPCLTTLRREGFALGLVTNGDARLQREKLARHALAPLFDAILIEGEFGVGKPDVTVYRHVLGLLGIAPSAATMVGDNLEWDVVGAERAGLAGIWLVRAGRGDATATACVTIRTLAELTPASLGSLAPRRRRGDETA
jgi:putative hydrolase of the HAD superfamily